MSDIDLKRHKGQYASVLGWNGSVQLTRWNRGNPVHGATYDLAPDEADKLADLLRNYAQQARASNEELERFEIDRQKVIDEHGPGTAPLFVEWRALVQRGEWFGRSADEVKAVPDTGAANG